MAERTFLYELSENDYAYLYVVEVNGRVVAYIDFGLPLIFVSWRRLPCTLRFEEQVMHMP